MERKQEEARKEGGEVERCKDMCGSVDVNNMDNMGCIHLQTGIWTRPRHHWQGERAFTWYLPALSAFQCDLIKELLGFVFWVRIRVELRRPCVACVPFVAFRAFVNFGFGIIFYLKLRQQ